MLTKRHIETDGAIERIWDYKPEWSNKLRAIPMETTLMQWKTNSSYMDQHSCRFHLWINKRFTENSENSCSLKTVYKVQRYAKPCRSKCEVRSSSDRHSVVSDSLPSHRLRPTRLLCPWGSPGKNTGVHCHSLLQRIFPTQGLNPGLLHCRQIPYRLSYRDDLNMRWTISQNKG